MLLADAAVKAVILAVAGEFDNAVDTAGVPELLLPDIIGDLEEGFSGAGEFQVDFF
jgi:hypothetical protein